MVIKIKCIWMLCLTFHVSLFTGTSFTQTIPYEAPYGYTVKAKVARVIDGDTFVITDSTRIRLLGVDTPELGRGSNPDEDFSIEATNLTKTIIGNNIVKLTFETKTRDMFDRVLAYVWLTDTEGRDSVFLQAELLKTGYARIRYYPEGSRYYDVFYNLRRTAMKKDLGIWGSN